ncbi:MAG TPA: 4-alpha-glucanotransferase [Candidatus Limnocylindria bacterium]|nr:4-alpha-glucanotransferase [Candidatus Limnocylindria bacterium]
MTGPAPVEAVWIDAWGRRQVTTERARRSVQAAIGADQRELERAARSVEIAARGAAVQPGELTLEDGTQLGHVARLPRDIPYGYHRLRRDAEECLLLVAPPRCPLPDGIRSWGWAVQLYALRSARSWGIGDLDDLRRLAEWSARRGAGALLLSPLGAANPAPAPEPSPYYPSSRRFRDPIHLAVERVPGYDRLAHQLAPMARAARKLNAQRSIRRGDVQALKLRALDRIWHDAEAARQDPAFVAFEAAHGDGLRRWGLFAALSEERGPGWQRWPSSLHDPAGTAARGAAERLADRVRFHAWLQWLLDRQLQRAGRRLRLVGDLPIGFDPGGFDAWTWQAQLADASLGAPPDVFNPGGQRWDLPPFIPHRLQLAGYGPFIETIRAAMGGGGGLRIDHVLGLFRQWWVPGVDPAAGAYVRQPTEELLAVLAIEAERADAIVIGEDLGTVAPGIRRRLASANVLSTRLAIFERRPPARWPHRSLAAVTTHDLPTTAGTWSGIDLDDQRRSGVEPNGAGLGLLRRRLARVGGLPPNASMEEVVEAVHKAVAAAPSVLATCTVEDALLEPLRPNMPGTGPATRENWSRALSKPLERLMRDPLVRRLAAAMQGARDRAG